MIDTSVLHKLGVKMQFSPDDEVVAEGRVLIDAAAELGRKTKALEDIKHDLDHCDWSCQRCGDDYGMMDTDIYLSCLDGLGLREEVVYPPPEQSEIGKMRAAINEAWHLLHCGHNKSAIMALDEVRTQTTKGKSND